MYSVSVKKRDELSNIQTLKQFVKVKLLLFPVYAFKKLKQLR